MLLREQKDPQTAYNQHILEITGKTHTIGTFCQESNLMKQIHSFCVRPILLKMRHNSIENKWLKGDSISNHHRVSQLVL